jgi:surface-anchored protein
MTAVACSARSLARLSIAVSLAFATAAWAEPVTTILSAGHVDIFEAEYEELIPGQPELHLGVHNDAGDFEPGDVILEVKNAAYRSTTGLPGAITALLGPNAWVLPADLEEADALGVIEAGVAKAGTFPDASAVTFTLMSAGASNPGNFVLYSSANSIRLSATGGTVGTNIFSTTAGHIHYNWGFSVPGTYTFEMQASYTDPVAGLLQSPAETYTFQVVPEPSTWALAGAAMLGGMGLRRFRRPGACGEPPPNKSPRR